MGVYITTSKNPSLKTRTFCEALSRLVPMSSLEQRGSKSVEQISKRAKLLGKSRVLFVYEKNATPSEMCFMKVKAHSWEWAGEGISISKFRVHKIPSGLPSEMIMKGDRKEEFEELLDSCKPEGDDFVELRCSKSKLSFYYEKRPLMEMELIK